MNAVATLPPPETRAVAAAPSAPAWLAGITGSLADAMPVAKLLAGSGLVPNAYAGKPEAILIAGAMGARLGLDLFSALAGIAVVNGKPTLYGDTMLAVCQHSPDFVDLVEVIEGDGASDATTAVCTVSRRNRQDYVATFSFADAKRAGLWGKQGPWTQQPKRMCAMRARAFALRGAFADALSGFHAREEIDDLVDATPDPIPAAKPAVRRTVVKAAEVLPAEVIKDATPATEQDGPAADHPQAEITPQAEKQPAPATMAELLAAAKALFDRKDIRGRLHQILTDFKIAKIQDAGEWEQVDRERLLAALRSAITADGAGQ